MDFYSMKNSRNLLLSHKAERGLRGPFFKERIAKKLPKTIFPRRRGRHFLVFFFFSFSISKICTSFLVGFGEISEGEWWWLREELTHERHGPYLGGHVVFTWSTACSADLLFTCLPLIPCPYLVKVFPRLTSFYGPETQEGALSLSQPCT